jgi:acetyl esterase
MTTYGIDPELTAVLGVLPAVTLEDIDGARQRLSSLLPPVEIDTTGVHTEDRMVPGPAGAPDVRVRVFRPAAGPTGVPAILSIHGGGFVLGTIDMENPGATRLVQELGVVVVSVDYRLAPEHPFPAGIEDCYAALTWLHDNTTELGVDATRVAVMGTSAGGGLAAGLSLLARDRGGPALCFQFLAIPELDDRLETVSMTQFVDTPMWNRPSAVLSWKMYLGEAAPSPVPPYAAPARAEDLSGLPPAYVSVAEFDPLRDEGVIYALRLMQAGVSTELHAFPRTFHGSGMMPGAAVSRRQAAETLTVLRKALEL